MNKKWKCPECGAINTNWRIDTTHKIKTKEKRYIEGVCQNCNEIEEQKEKEYQESIKKAEQKKKIQSFLHKSQLPPKIANAKFENLIIRKGAEIAFKTFKKIEKADRWIFVYGKNNTGKTLLMGAAINSLTKKLIPTFFFKERELFRRLKGTMGDKSKKTIYEIFNYFYQADIIFWDDFLMMEYTPWEYKIAYEISDLCDDYYKILVLNSNVNFKEKLKFYKMNPDENPIKRITARLDRNKLFFIEMKNKPF